jgi:ubiquinone/menaquinone biosynthesis C-methylase UbiE
LEQNSHNETRKEFAHQAEHMASAAAFHAEPVLRWLLSAVRSGPAARVMDLACGPGIAAEAIAPGVGEVIGIDVTPEMIRLARQRFCSAGLKNGEFSTARAEHLPFPSGSFEQVVTRLSLHHFAEAGAVLSEVRRVLRKKGLLVVADVLSSEIPEESVLHNALEQLRDPTHVRMFSRSELLKVIDAAGFEILQEDSWLQPRAFREWAAITGNPARTAPLEQVMRALTRTGQTAGIRLREESGELHFTHSWIFLMVRAG